ncbi:DUF3159 domain-containing protein [Modestobacter sp. I12A-02628]|uniref:DUF3159 domain-containing protein n=2 Tax=Goekera deserti TaxID=2497753 RepID=A0A7K3WDR3_9ACTN|nr:DUF3159 domain-containing protein [Goekera deserti]NDI46939.1 DUF3159 domain-containing protein [Goekera deserti]NEL54507.1 DUF3159 domain-containing protein [Goekera deserti]
MVLDQLGGWRGMVDASLPTIAFIVANSLGELRTGIWAAGITAALVFLLRLVRRESVQQAFSGVFGVAIAVFIAARSGEARNFFVPGLIRNIAIGVVLLGSTVVRWPLVGVIAEFLAPSHLGTMAAHSTPSLRGLARGRRPSAPPAPSMPSAPGARPRDAAPERHWRQDRRVLRAYTWLTVLWAGTFLVRSAVTGFFYVRDEVGLLGTSSLLLGLPVTGAALLVTLWVVARLHRHRAPDPA